MGTLFGWQGSQDFKFQISGLGFYVENEEKFGKF